MNTAAVRAQIRALRDVRGVGGLVRAVDRLWWYRTIRRARLADSEFYAAQLRLRRLPTNIAIWHYVIRGFRRGLSLNPLFDEVFAGGGLPEVFRVPALYAYLVGERPTIAVNPWWDAVATSYEQGAPALEDRWADHGNEIVLRVGQSERRVTVAAFREMALRAARQWSARGGRARIGGAGGERDAEPTLVLRFVQTRDRRYHGKLEQVARLVQSRKASGVVAMVCANASQWVSASALVEVDSRLAIELHRAPRTWGQVLSEQASNSWGSRTMVVLDARAEFTDAEIGALADEGRCSLAIPAHREQDGTLAGLGAAHVGGAQLYRILESHPIEDAALIGDRILDVPMATGRSFSAPVSTYGAAGGVRCSERLEALSLRLSRLGVPSRVLLDVSPVLDEPDIAEWAGRASEIVDVEGDDRRRVEQIIDDAGFDVIGWREQKAHALAPELRWRRPHPDARRWAIKICAPAGRQGSVWGDTHFARGLASALTRRGHAVVIDAYDARDRASGYLDDVSVAIRGPYRIDRPAWGISMQWIISHPDEITRAEVAQHDRVFAAAVGWSRRKSAHWKIRIDPLLEATDTDLFQPRGLARGSDIVFVGTARGIPRPSVVAPLAAGIPVKVYGPDWRPFVPQAAIAAQFIPNADLPERYETASIVLNDQWPAMRREGFIAMRPFDAVAVAGRVVSESVEGVEEIFGGAVVAYESAADLVKLLQGDPADIFPSDDEMAEIARRIRSEHSFDARAAVLDQAVREVEENGRGRSVPTVRLR